MMEAIHTFHIPVMGTAFTIDTPVKVAMYGISSVVSCVDDTLVERMRKFYSRVTGTTYIPIQKSEHDSRARRVTEYLNLLDMIVRERFEKLKASAFEIGSEITKYFEMLSDNSPLKQMYATMLTARDPAKRKEFEEHLRERIRPGAIDINIMTKLDRTNFSSDGEQLPVEYSDAMAALRGYALSELNSSIVFSAGFNGRLYGYVEQFDDFHADTEGRIRKKIIVKVNDYRSALTQGKFFAKKGLWVSEFRLESGLNCGGHAFGQGGNLMGPSLEEFRQRREELVATLFGMYNKALAQKGRKTFDKPHPVKITAQGGIGTAAEHEFLLKYYNLDATGWGTPFLVVPEVTTTDPETLKRLCDARAADLFLSDVSPLGVPFNNLRNSLSEERKEIRNSSGKYGSPCTKGHLMSNTEFTELPICTASRLYQLKKLQQVRDSGISGDELEAATRAITCKTCLCNDLGGTAMNLHELLEPGDLSCPPAICPGPNLAFFDGPYTLSEMIDHIYGRRDLLEGIDRPNMFVNELWLTIDYLKSEIRKTGPVNDQRIKYLQEYKDNLLAGIAYYEELIPEMISSAHLSERMGRDLEACRVEINNISSSHPQIFD